MPAQKRSLDETLQENLVADAEMNNNQEAEQPEGEFELDRSRSSDNEDSKKGEDEEDGFRFRVSSYVVSLRGTRECRGGIRYVAIRLADVRKEVQCPICLGIIRKTRTVMECLHRFCRDCIDKSMRLGNNECPACRTHCASRRSLRDDPNYDALIAAIYPDIDKYEEEEFSLREDEVTHSKQIQASIAQTVQRQSEALSKKRNARATAAAFMRRSHGNSRTSLLRRQRNFRNFGDLPVSNDNEDMNDNDGRKDLSSDDEQSETMQRRCKRGREGEAQFPQHSASTDPDGAGDQNTPEVNREIISASGTLSWGKNGHRSNNRVNGKNAKNNRISRVVEHLRNSAVKDDEQCIFLILVSLDEQRIPKLEEPYLCCKPTMSVKILCKHVANKTALPEDEVELWFVLKPQGSIVQGERTVDPDKDNLRVLGDQETLAELVETHENASYGHLVIAYKRKLQNSEPQTQLS